MNIRSITALFLLVMSCSCDALSISGMGTTQLRAAGVKAGDDVVVPAYSGDDAAAAVSELGARPVFADMDPHTFCLDAESAESVVTPGTSALVGVPLHGHPVDLARFEGVAGRHGLKVVVWGPSVPGDTVDARRRRQHAEYLGRRLSGVGKPSVADGVAHAFTEYVVRVPGNGRPDRDAFKRALQARGVACHVPVRVPTHRRPEFFSAVRLPEAERASEETLAIALQASMTKRELHRIASACNALGGLLMEPAC